MGSVEIKASSLHLGAREPGIQPPLLLGVCPVTAEVFGPRLFPSFLPLGLHEGWGLVAREKEFRFVPSEAETLVLPSGFTWLH